MIDKTAGRFAAQVSPAGVVTTQVTFQFETFRRTAYLTKGYAVTLTVPVDTRTTPSGGDAPGGDGRPGGVPGGAPPSGMPPSGGPSPANS